MGENTKIEWATHTWNPWIGCTKVGPPCDFCYAENMMDRRYGRVKWGAGQPRVRTSGQNWRQPIKWNKAAREAGRRDTVFCLSLGDIWDNEVDPQWRGEAFYLMRSTPNLIYLLLSKRIGNAIDMCRNVDLPRNAALGATMADQKEWDRDLPKLLEAATVLHAEFTFASVEPMLGPIDCLGQFPSWMICGGESGPHARPMHPDWPRSLRDQCDAADVPFLFKQNGEWRPTGGHSERIMSAKEEGACPVVFHPDGDVVRVGKVKAGRLLDGIEHNGFPAAITRYKPEGATP